MRGRVALLVVLALLFVALAAWQWRTTRRYAAAEEVCAAVTERRYDDAIALGAALDAIDPPGFLALDCRCIAHLAKGEVDRCLIDLEPAVAAGMSPSADVARAAAATWFERGQAASAAVVARRAAAEDPQDADLFELELVSRSIIEDSNAVLAELEARARAPGAPEKERRVLATAFLRRGEHERCLDVLGVEPPTGPAADDWQTLRARCLAMLFRFPELRSHWEAYARRGGNADVARLRPIVDEALVTTTPTPELVERLGAVFAEIEKLPDPKLRESVAGRYARFLGAYGRVDEASKVLQRAQELGLSMSLTEGDLRAAASATGQGRGRLRVIVKGAPGDARVLVAPAPELRFDAPYTEVALAGEPPSAILERRLDDVATRIVVVDGGGAVIASGAGWPSSGGNVLELEARAPFRAPSVDAPAPPPADGRRRLIVVIPDAGDWRLAGYLMARGELPVLKGLLDRGWRAVLESTPAYTAAAMRSLVWPERVREIGVLSLVHELGDEIGGLASVGKNPFAGLAMLLPPRRSIFDVVGNGEQVAANMLFTHGGMDAGRHAERVGPRGARGRVDLGPPLRKLTPEERTRWPALAPRNDYIDTVAGELTALLSIVEKGEIDFLLLRIEPLDIISHGHLATVSGGQQDDGAGVLYDTYRMIDHELGRAIALLDADDTVIVMSDHGAKNGLEHDPNAMFVMVGPDVPHGAAPGRPALLGAPRVFAERLGVETSWPDTGIAPWLTATPDR